MTEPVSPLATFYKPGWEHYQHALIQTIAPLSSEQLALSLGPQQRSIGELLDHLIGARYNWFHLWMKEGDPTRDWNDDEATSEPPLYQAASLVALFEKSWHVISCALDRWTCADLEQLFFPPASHQAWLRAQGLEEAPLALLASRLSTVADGFLPLPALARSPGSGHSCGVHCTEPNVSARGDILTPVQRSSMRHPRENR